MLPGLGLIVVPAGALDDVAVTVAVPENAGPAVAVLVSWFTQDALPPAARLAEVAKTGGIGDATEITLADIATSGALTYPEPVW